VTDPVAVALVVVWLLSGGAAVAVLAWLYRREVAREEVEPELGEPADGLELELDWLPVWGWPDRP
jgi:hypothetical protein